MILIVLFVASLLVWFPLSASTLEADLMCRAIQMPDHRVTVVCPVEQGRRSDEDDAAFYTRVMERTYTANSAWRGMPFADIKLSDLPQDWSQRQYWRLRDGRVVIEAPVGEDR